jgi:phosphoserine phosphatase
MKHTFLAALLGLAALAAGAAPTLREDLPWHGDNRARLNKMIAEHGRGSPGYQASAPPVAVFDFDNTTVKNDIGDGLVFWMLANSKVLQPPGRDWKAVSPLLTDAAVAALKAACDAQAEPGQPLTTDQSTAASRACADEIVAVYDTDKTSAGAPAYLRGADDFVNPAYALAVQLLAGYTPDEVRAMARATIDFNLAQPVGAKQRIGNREVAGYIRRYEQIEDLMRTLRNAGFDVWIVSASAQQPVEVFGAYYGVPADHVVGVRATLDAKGRLTARFQGAGRFADGNAELITYRDGKRYWINKAVFGERDPARQMQPTNRLHDRLVFVAGDSDTDLSMLKDARYKLVLNRNKTELMCHAFHNDGGQGHWWVNPMFIDPKPQKSTPYGCGKWGLPDQPDKVY